MCGEPKMASSSHHGNTRVFKRFGTWSQLFHGGGMIILYSGEMEVVNRLFTMKKL